MEVPVEEIVSDPNHPRISIDPVEISEIAQNMKTVGVINPIEIDQNKMIVTGERRWRAAKKAGFKTVPCRILPMPDASARLVRQIVSNRNGQGWSLVTGDLLAAINNLLYVDYELDHCKDKNAATKLLAKKLFLSEEEAAEYMAMIDEDTLFRRNQTNRKIRKAYKTEEWN